MVDAHASGACGETHAGSSPVFGKLKDLKFIEAPAL